MQKSTTIIGVLSMLEDGYSYRDVQARYALGNSTITDIKRKFSLLSIPLNELASKNSDVIENLFYGNSHPRKDTPLPDFKPIYQAITDKKRRVNLYFFWIDYKKEFPDGYQYTQFKFYFKKWLNQNHLEENLSMAINRVPGEIIYIDWAGDTLPLVLNSETGELKKAHLFLTTVGVSSYCFAMAFPDEKVNHFITGTVKALEFYGAVPKILKPDNTKTASIKNTKDTLILNEAYADLQMFYNVVIVPAPVRKPRGKPSVENHVKWLETHLLEKLRGRFFTSFDDLNLEISIIMNELNTRPYQKDKKGNRLQVFETFDKPSMKPLPKDSFVLYDYKICTVPSNYHIAYDNHYYSVPFSYYKQELTVKASLFDIIICDQMNRQICKHKRSYQAFPKYMTLQEHMPSSHQYYDKENRYDAAAYKNWAKTIGEDVYHFICRIIAKYQFEEQSYKSCNGILHLCKDVPKTYANKAAKECIEANVITYSGFKSLLNQLKNERLTNQSHLPEHSNLRGKDEYK